MQKDSRFVSRYRLVMSRTEESLDDDSYQGIALAIPHGFKIRRPFRGCSFSQQNVSAGRERVLKTEPLPV